MKNKKIMTIILCIFAVVCVFAALVFSGVINLKKSDGDEITTDPDIPNVQEDDYTKGSLADISSDAPLLSTNIDDIFYTMSKDGEVKFFRFDNDSNTLTQIDASGTYDVSVNMSEHKISAAVTYYKDGDDIAGYGLFTGKNGEYNLYPYAFFRLTNFGDDYEKSVSGKCLLLVDTTEDDFYSENKIYEEPFVFYYETSKTERLLSEASRTVGINGTKRADYSMLNDTVINNSEDNILFFSGRHYPENESKVDLLRSGGSGNNTDNILLVSDILGYWVKNTDDGIMYVSVDNIGNVFVGSCDNSGKSKTIKTFESVSRDDVLVSNGCIYNIKTNKIYSTADDKEIELGYKNSDALSVDMFFAMDDTFVVRGYLKDSSVPVLITAKINDGSVVSSFANSDLKNLVNPCAVGDDNFMFTVVSGDKFTSYIIGGLAA